MKKKLKLLTLFSFMALALTGCGKTPLPFNPSSGGYIDVPWKDFTYPITNLVFSEEEQHLDLPINTSHEYVFDHLPEYALKSQLVWKSDKEDIASIKIEGKTNEEYKAIVSGHQVGSAVITVSSTEEVTWEPIKLYVNVVIPVESFAIEDVTMDIGSTYKIEPTFTPEDTSYRVVEYETEETGLISIENGVITSGLLEGTVHVRATMPQLPDFFDEFTVTVSTIHVEAIELTAKEVSLEINKTTFLVPKISPEAAVDYFDYRTYGIVFDNLTPDIIEVDERGNVKALKEGTGKVTAKCGEITSNVLEIEVYEVHAVAIDILDENDEPIVTTVNLNNTNNPTIQLKYAYTTDVPGRYRPTRGNASFVSGDSNVATVSEEGLVTVVGKGSTRISITDSTYGVSDYIEVSVTIYCTSLTIVADTTEVYVNQTANISVTTVPASGITTETVTYSIPEAAQSIAELTVNGNTATLKALDEGKVTVTATLDDCTATKEFTFSYDDTFYDGIAYIVGDQAYNTGVSIPVSGGSWDKAHLASSLDEIDPDPTVPTMYYQSITTIEFDEGDIWKLREGSAYRTQGDADGGYEPVAYGCVIDDIHMKFLEESNNNIEVLEAGSYDILYKKYTDDTWSVFVRVTPTLNVTPTSLIVDVNQTKDVTVKDATGTVTLEEYDTEKVLVTSKGNGVYSVKGLAYTEEPITLTWSDDENSCTCTVTVAKDFEKNIPYVVGDKAYNTGISTPCEKGSWSDPTKAYKMFEYPSEDKEVKTQYKAQIKFNAGDEWKIRSADDEWYEGAEYENAGLLSDGTMTNETAGGGNVTVNKAVVADIYFKITTSDAVKVYVGKANDLAFEKSKVSLLPSTSTTVKIKDVIGTVKYEASEEGVVTLTPTTDGVKIDAGTTEKSVTVTATDSYGRTATLSVNVTHEPLPDEYTYTVNFSVSWPFDASAKIYAWVFDTGTWVLCERVGASNSVKFTVDAELTNGFNLARFDPNVSPQWDKEWNKTEDIKVSAGVYTYSAIWH